MSDTRRDTAFQILYGAVALAVSGVGFYALLFLYSESVLYAGAVTEWWLTNFDVTFITYPSGILISVVAGLVTLFLVIEFYQLLVDGLFKNALRAPTGAGLCLGTVLFAVLATLGLGAGSALAGLTLPASPALLQNVTEAVTVHQVMSVSFTLGAGFPFLYLLDTPLWYTVEEDRVDPEMDFTQITADDIPDDTDSTEESGPASGSEESGSSPSRPSGPANAARIEDFADESGSDEVDDSQTESPPSPTPPQPPESSSPSTSPQSSDSPASPESAGGEDPPSDPVDATSQSKMRASSPSDGNNSGEDSAGFDPSDWEYDWARHSDTDLSDVGGLKDVVEEIRRDIVYPYNDGLETAKKFDIPFPNILLQGPPGTGKSLLSKALASEVSVPYLSLSTADIVSQWVNDSPGIIKELFDEIAAVAEEQGGAVVFLDEIDGVTPDRSGEIIHSEDKKQMSELLTGIAEVPDSVVFIAATNTPDEVDPAIKRSGRFDKKIEVPYPDYEARIEILKIHFRHRPTDLEEADFEWAAEQAEEGSGAYLEQVAIEAARHAGYSRDGDAIIREDLRHALESIEPDESDPY